jgi:hypothetical protein
MPATTTAMVRSVWQNYFYAMDGQEKAAAAAAEAAAAAAEEAAVAEEVEDDPLEEDLQVRRQRECILLRVAACWGEDLHVPRHSACACGVWVCGGCGRLRRLLLLRRLLWQRRWRMTHWKRTCRFVDA